MCELSIGVGCGMLVCVIWCGQVGVGCGLMWGGMRWGGVG